MYAVSATQMHSRGLYLVTREIANKLGTHYAILDVGNVLGREGVYLPTIYELRPEGFSRTIDTTKVVFIAKIEDERGAIERFANALTHPKYDVLTNNCEHFARFVAFGDRSSRQARALGLASIAAVGLVFALASE